MEPFEQLDFIYTPSADVAADIVRIEGGLIVEHRGLTDIVGLMRQLND